MKIWKVLSNILKEENRLKELEFYKKRKILKVSFFKDEVRMNIENENLEFIRNNKNIVKNLNKSF